MSARGQLFGSTLEVGLQGLAEAFPRLGVILEWRAAEVAWAEQLAVHLRANHFLIAVKHPCSLVLDLLYTGKRPIYISHPISAVRALLAEGNEEQARAIIAEINDLTMRFRSSELVIPFSPTSIDELRIEEQNGTWRPALQERWPPGPEDQLLFVSPETSVTNPFDPSNVAASPDIDAREVATAFSLLLEVFSERLLSQINWRDRKLVEQCQGLAVYRPYYGGRISLGVYEEIRHRNELEDHHADQAGSRPCVVLSLPEDLALWRTDYISAQLQEEARLENGTELGVALADQIRKHLASDPKIVAGLRDGTLEGAQLKAVVEEVTTLEFRGAPRFGGPLDGVPATRREAWMERQWRELAEKASHKDWIREQLRADDVLVGERLSVEEFVTLAEQRFSEK